MLILGEDAFSFFTFIGMILFKEPMSATVEKTIFKSHMTCLFTDPSPVGVIVEATESHVKLLD